MGDLIYDQSIRLEHRYLNPKVDLKFIQILFVTIFKTYDFLIFFEKFNQINLQAPLEKQQMLVSRLE